MGAIRETGLIIKQNDYGEGHRRLSIFTANYGIIQAVSYGAKRQKHKSAASSQFLCYGDFELYLSNRDFANVNSVNVKEAFLPISEDIVKLSLCNYLADITYAMLGQGNADERMLNVMLNSIYALAYREEKPDKIKAVYELKLMSIEGYMPNISSCVCGSSEVTAFDFDKGSVVCGGCRGSNSRTLNTGAIKALHYIVNAEDRRMLAFTGNDELYYEIGILAEKYLMTHIDREFKSLEYYKMMRDSMI